MTHLRFLSIVLACMFALAAIAPARAASSAEDVPRDTLWLHVEWPSSCDELARSHFASALDSLIEQYNSNERSLKFLRSEEPKPDAVNLKWGNPDYAPLRRSYWLTGMNVVLLGANLLILPYFIPILPFYIIPIARCDLEINEGVDWLELEQKQTIHCSAYFRSEAKQRALLSATMVNDLDSKLKKWQRQYQRNMKRKLRKTQ